MKRIRDVVPVWRLERMLETLQLRLRLKSPAVTVSPEVEGAPPEVVAVLRELFQLPAYWHAAGTLTPQALRAIAMHAACRDVQHSVETGAGKSTILFSYMSADHKVFVREPREDDSVTRVRESPLLRLDRVEWIFGPTQRTLPRYQFSHRLQLALLDGPHGYPFPELEYYCLYPHLDEDALLIVDDIHIPTIFRLFAFLLEEPMLELLEVAGTTALFRRTSAPLFDPFGDSWWQQEYNQRRFPVSASRIKASLRRRERQPPPPRLTGIR
jgi:Methyltransferase domain